MQKASFLVTSLGTRFPQLDPNQDEDPQSASHLVSHPYQKPQQLGLMLWEDSYFLPHALSELSHVVGTV